MIRAPNRDTPEKRPDIVRARRDAILAVMHDHDWINDAQFAAAKTPRRRVHRRHDSAGAVSVLPARASRRHRERDRRRAPSSKAASRSSARWIRDAQRNAERVAARAPAQLEATHSWLRAQARSEPLQVALLSVDPRNGGIRALVGGSDYNVSPFDRTSAMHRQPGSAFKTFAYLAAIASKKATTGVAAARRAGQRSPSAATKRGSRTTTTSATADA